MAATINKGEEEFKEIYGKDFEQEKEKWEINTYGSVVFKDDKVPATDLEKARSLIEFYGLDDLRSIDKKDRDRAFSDIIKFAGDHCPDEFKAVLAAAGMGVNDQGETANDLLLKDMERAKAIKDFSGEIEKRWRAEHEGKKYIDWLREDPESFREFKEHFIKMDRPDIVPEEAGSGGIFQYKEQIEDRIEDQKEKMVMLACNAFKKYLESHPANDAVAKELAAAGFTIGKIEKLEQDGAKYRFTKKTALIHGERLRIAYEAYLSVIYGDEKNVPEGKIKEKLEKYRKGARSSLKNYHDRHSSGIEKKKTGEILEKMENKETLTPEDIRFMSRIAVKHARKTGQLLFNFEVHHKNKRESSAQNGVDVNNYANLIIMDKITHHAIFHESEEGILKTADANGADKEYRKWFVGDVHLGIAHLSRRLGKPQGRELAETVLADGIKGIKTAATLARVERDDKVRFERLLAREMDAVYGKGAYQRLVSEDAIARDARNVERPAKKKFARAAAAIAKTVETVKTAGKAKIAGIMKNDRDRR